LPLFFGKGFFDRDDAEDLFHRGGAAGDLDESKFLRGSSPLRIFAFLGHLPTER
jgi:hypothetical protein